MEKKGEPWVKVGSIEFKIVGDNVLMRRGTSEGRTTLEILRLIYANVGRECPQCRKGRLVADLRNLSDFKLFCKTCMTSFLPNKSAPEKLRFSSLARLLLSISCYSQN